MDANDILGRVRDTATVRQVFGDPYERDGALVVPVAHIRGGGGGGSGTQEGSGDTRGGSGWGGGVGVDARPVGVYVIRGDEVEFKPAVDVTRIVVGGQMVAIVALLVARSIVRRLAAR